MTGVAMATTVDFPRPGEDTILNPGELDGKNSVISDDIADEDDVINLGIDAIAWENIKGIYGEKIEDNATAWEKVTNLMKWFINYALGLIGLVALWYLVVNGFIMLTAGNDEEKSKRWMKGIKVAVIAITGIALSWFILSLIFFLIFTVTDL